jgi:hypothetical protein
VEGETYELVQAEVTPTDILGEPEQAEQDSEVAIVIKVGHTHVEY